MTPAERLSRADWLAAIGVPLPFRDAIIDAPSSRLTSSGGAVLGLAMVAVVVSIVAAAFIWLDSYVQARAFSSCEPKWGYPHPCERWPRAAPPVVRLAPWAGSPVCSPHATE
jgi:hypothetical protein